MTEKKPRSSRKMGRPTIPLVVKTDDTLPAREIDWNQLNYWVDLGATAEEIAGSFRISTDTLTRRIKEKFNMTFAELKERCSGSAKIKLRQNQFKLSEKNAAIAIWLGKIWLGQVDPEVLHKNMAIGESLQKLADHFGILDKTRDPLIHYAATDARVIGSNGDVFTGSDVATQ